MNRQRQPPAQPVWAQHSNQSSGSVPPPQQQQQQQPATSGSAYYMNPSTPNNLSGQPNAQQWQPQPQMQTRQPPMQPMQPTQPMQRAQPAATSSMHSQPMSSPQQPQSPQGGWPANFPGADNPLASMGMAYGQRFVQQKISWFQFFTPQLKYYFHVSNQYVLNKIKILFLPCLHKNWKREDEVLMDASGQQHSVAKPPRDDLNAPDLYIPTMAFITYILVYALALGIHHRFTPEVLGLTASSAFAALVLEVGLLKLGFFVVSDTGLVQPPLLDLLAYAAYKYVGCVLDLIVGVVFGSFACSVLTLVTGISFALFMIRTVRWASTARDPMMAGGMDSPGGVGGDNSKRKYFLLVVGLLQLLLCFFLVRNAFPGAPVATVTPLSATPAAA